jgi:hypothetical protein
MDIKNNYQEDKITENTINKGKPIYYKKMLHYIVYEFGENILGGKFKCFFEWYCIAGIKSFCFRIHLSI